MAYPIPEDIHPSIELLNFGGYSITGGTLKGGQIFRIIESSYKIRRGKRTYLVGINIQRDGVPFRRSTFFKRNLSTLSKKTAKFVTKSLNEYFKENESM